ncbi:hypothetical protein ISN45_Aa05g011330 [Arabidopsis thaliana x Arabidopsis arenosa]|uniref:BED-type domain-containing protein n=1 Tax=Arabidopsis thaliana x Arabidopsis arenosa TaxID=1240361 RepID=A0A8T1ZN02_9BRAS|nr:hypothetical protein ISN45_Aa05g011330 [Arabidopsis thaliana x Arabidopsis arenosa]
MRLGDLLEALTPGRLGVMRASTRSAPQKEKDPPKNLNQVRKHPVPVLGKYGSWTCIYCKKVANGGVQRAKQHIVGGFKNVTQCSIVPPNVREEIKDFMLKKAEIKATTQMMPPPSSSYDDYDYEEEEEVEALASKRGQPPVKKRKGPMDRFVCPTPPDVLKGRKDNRKYIF